jgi:4-hydroxy-tetrahydrodipicolinate reductase
MIRILLSGANGSMGRVLSEVINEKKEIYSAVCGIDMKDNKSTNFPVFSDPEHCDIPCDVIIDFSHPSCLERLLEFAEKNKVPIVIATTGIQNAGLALIEESSKKIPVFFSANMSIGVNLLSELIKKAASVLQHSFDIEIIEKHHNQKIDAPSGTALMLAKELNKVLEPPADLVYDRHVSRTKRSPFEMGMHAVRGGTIVGEHTVLFAGMDEIIEVKHTALSKRIFASGALDAAAYLITKPPGLYDMHMFVGDSR